MSTSTYGAYFSNTQLNDITQSNLGVVYKKTAETYEVKSGQRTIICRLSSRLRENMQAALAPHSRRREHGTRNRKPALSQGETGDVVVVGDHVRFVDTPEGSGMIVEVLPRQNKLSRRSAVPMPGAHAAEQIIAANLDQVIPIFAIAKPMPKWNMLDRYLVTAEAHNLPALICITKLDLAKEASGAMDSELSEVVEDYRRIGYPVILVSAHTGEGIDTLKAALRGRISIFLGKSGVGKTSLLNALQPGLGLRVNEVSQVTRKGMHTTTHHEMFPLDIGGSVVDTPGVREFGLWDIQSEDLALYFPEMRPYVGKCRFGRDCQHDEEPGCAVRKAVMAGAISPRRYQSYMRLLSDA